jgi:hypothetical protein
MPYKDPEARKAYQRAYDNSHKEQIKAYREANKQDILEKQKAYQKCYNETHKDDRKIYNQTFEGKKSMIISGWKQQGLLHDDYENLYDTYLQRTHCDICKSDFKDSFDRCMDHDHDTGLFRQFLCRACNNNDSWKKKLKA